MNKLINNDNFDKLLSLSKEEIEGLFSNLSLIEIEKIIDKLNEVVHND